MKRSIGSANTITSRPTGGLDRTELRIILLCAGDMSTPNPTEEVGWNFASDPNDDDIEQPEDLNAVYEQLMNDGTLSHRFLAPLAHSCIARCAFSDAR